MFKSIESLVNESVSNPKEFFSTQDIGNKIRLADFVDVTGQSYTKRGDNSLKRYLVGANLLGADHLQFPENILLAACDLTRQNAEDNVVYSEIRCATTGYNCSGMNVFDATDLLCKGFDLAALFFGSCAPDKRLESCTQQPPNPPGTTWESILNSARQRWQQAPQRWIRTNILLGAKRHKRGDIEKVVPLVVHYLERGPEVWRRGNVSQTDRICEPGHWWRICQVAGFDLSGNEEAAGEQLEASVRPLFAACSPITIHAGEAMSARSIWEAVYTLSAQRIGHGLRLRDDDRLLEHCARNNICMELCPVSNFFRICSSTLKLQLPIQQIRIRDLRHEIITRSSIFCTQDWKFASIRTTGACMVGSTH
jgi:hypothetical protein